MQRSEIIDLIHNERERQNQLHPEWHGDNHGLAVLAEEFGEVAKALYEMNEAYRIGSDFQVSNAKDEMASELIQVASVCFRWLENIKEG